MKIIQIIRELTVKWIILRFHIYQHTNQAHSMLLIKKKLQIIKINFLINLQENVSLLMMHNLKKMKFIVNQ